MSDDRRGNGTRRPRGEATTGRSEDARVPYDHTAEEAVLGAALLSKDAADVVAGLDPADFWIPRHRVIAEAIHELVRAGTKVDPVTVIGILRPRGEIGPGGLWEKDADVFALGVRTPSTSSAPHYAALVRDNATLRRLIAVSGEIRTLGLGSPGDVREAVTRAQRLVGDVGALSVESFSGLEYGDVAAFLAGDLTQESPDLLYRSDGQALFYAGRMHDLHGEPTSGKTFIALVAVVEVLAMGGSALYLDYEDTLKGIVGRLLALGAEPEALRTRFEYVKQDGAFGQTEKLDLAAKLRTLNPDLVVIDGVAEALAKDGLSEDKAPEVVTWIEKVPRWISRTGAAVVMLDHVGKDKESRGRWQRGSGAKLGAIDGTSYEVIVREAFSRKKAGRVDLKISKDRHGGVGDLGAIASSVTITPHANGERVVVELHPPTAPTSRADAWKPTILMKRASDELERAVSPMTASTLKALIHGERKLVSEAIERLMSEGWVVTFSAGSSKKFLRLVEPYDESKVAPGVPAPAPTLDLDDGDTNVVVGPWESLSDYERDRILLDGATHIEDPDHPEGDT